MARPLSLREVEVLRLVALGHTYRQAAGELGLAPSTVQTHVRRILEALEVPSAAAAVAAGIRDGYLRWSGPDALAPVVDPVVERAHRLYPSTRREWSAAMVDECRRPIVELLAGKIARLAVQ